MGVDEHWLKWSGAHASGHVESEYGYDIIFRESDGRTGLYHEIEEYDETNGTLVAWVRVDSLSKSADTTIYMYYGNACIMSPTEDPDNVWDDYFKGVWHLEEDVTDEGTSGNHDDSTLNGNDGAQHGNVEGTGKISYGQQFDGNDYVDMGNVLDYGKDDPMTYSAWIKTSGYWVQIDGKADDSTWHGVWFYLEEPGALSLYLYDASTNQIVKCSTDTFDDNQWHHVVATYDGSDDVSGLTLYGDGSALGIDWSDNQALGTVKNSYPFNIGAAMNTAFGNQ